MRRSSLILLMAAELAVIGFWYASLRIDTGFDSLQYQRMASAIVRTGFAPWVVSPLSYIGIYPGSDTSGVPFLAASFSILSGAPVTGTVLAYDATLLLLFGLGIFMLVRELTGKLELGLMAILMGSLAFGLFTATSWTLDERSFNVALAPVLLVLAIPLGSRPDNHASFRRHGLIGVVGLTMLVSHLSFLLLIPFLVLTPLVYRVVYRQYSSRRRRHSSPLYFGIIAFSPLALLTTLNLLGVLNSYGLQYQLENSALFSGNSPPVFLLNSLVFLGTRIGLVNIGCLLLGMAYLFSRPQLFPRNIIIGGFLLAGLLGLPIVLYSKDLLMPICVVIGAIGLGTITRTSNARRRTVVLAITTGLVVSGSLAFDAWNNGRTSRTADTRYWALPGVTSEAQSGNLWMDAQGLRRGCVYGNNPAMLQQVAFGPMTLVCDGLPIDTMINQDVWIDTPGGALQVVYIGISDPNPGTWFASPSLDRVSRDFATVPTLNYGAGLALLRTYNVSFIVVDLKRPAEFPLFEYQSVQSSPFFQGLWASQYPIYRTTTIALFDVD